MTSYLSYKRHMACLDADEDIIGWFTTKNGVHVPIRKGQTKETATKEFFESKPRTFNYTYNKSFVDTPEGNKLFHNYYDDKQKKWLDHYGSTAYKTAQHKMYEELHKYEASIKPKDWDKLVESEEPQPEIKEFYEKSRAKQSEIENRLDKEFGGVFAKNNELRKESEVAEAAYKKAKEQYEKNKISNTEKFFEENFGSTYNGKYYRFENGNEYFHKPRIDDEYNEIDVVPVGGGNDDRLSLGYYGSGNIVELTKSQMLAEWGNKVKNNETFGGLSDRDIRSLELYSHFTPQNAALREGKEEPYDTSRIRDIINRTYYKGGETVYRGVPKGIPEIESLQEGQIYTDKGFVSTSPHKDVAKNFSGPDGYVIKIKVATGLGKAKDIGAYSEKPDEDELLLQAGSQFKVLRVDHKKREIDLEQL